MMFVYVIRHADALPVGDEGISTDEQRPLSKAGHDQVKILACGFRQLGIELDVVAASPLLRAHQTAEGLVRGLASPCPVRTCDVLSPGGSSKVLGQLLAELHVEHVALVGHEPDVGRHTSWLIGSKKSRIGFAKAAAACVMCEPPLRKGAGCLLWMVTPQWLALPGQA